MEKASQLEVFRYYTHDVEFISWKAYGHCIQSTNSTGQVQHTDLSTIKTVPRLKQQCQFTEQNVPFREGKKLDAGTCDHHRLQGPPTVTRNMLKYFHCILHSKNALALSHTSSPKKII